MHCRRPGPFAHMMVWLALLCFLAAPVAQVAAFAQEVESGTPGWAEKIDKGLDALDSGSSGIVGAAKGAGEVAGKQKFIDGLNAIPQSDELNAFDKFQKVVGKYGKSVKHAAELFEGGIAVAKITNDLVAGEYRQATREAAAYLVGFVADFGIRALVAFVCATTTGPGMALCYIAATAALSEFVGAVKKPLGDWIGNKVADVAIWSYCQVRRCSTGPPGSNTAATGSTPGVGAPAGIGYQAASGGRGAPGATQGGASVGRSGGSGGASVGSTTIRATARNVTTTARNGGTAVTQIGSVSSGGGDTTVVAGDVVTEANGRTARTAIGSTGSGTVVTMGPVVNEGGNLTMGGNGTVSRNGQLCLDIYMNTCMVQIYPKPAHHPCAPAYVWKAMTNMCELPSDHDHQITRPGF